MLLLKNADTKSNKVIKLNNEDVSAKIVKLKYLKEE